MVSERAVKTSRVPKEVQTVTSGSVRGEILSCLDLEDFIGKESSPAHLFREKARILKTSASTCTTLVTLERLVATIGTGDLLVKEYRFKNLLHSLKTLFFEHRAQRVWRISRYLQEHGISVPEPLGYLFEHKGPFIFRGYFFSRAIPDARDLGRLAEAQENRDDWFGDHATLETLIRSIGALHESGVTHGDLKWSNILLNGREPRVWFVDLDSARLYGYPPGPVKIARDLARFVLNAQELGISARLVDLFIYGYARQRRLDRRQIDGPLEKNLYKLKSRHRRRYAAN